MEFSVKIAFLYLLYLADLTLSILSYLYREQTGLVGSRMASFRPFTDSQSFCIPVDMISYSYFIELPLSRMMVLDSGMIFLTLWFLKTTP